MKRYLRFGFAALFMAAMLFNFTSCENTVYRDRDRFIVQPITWDEEVDVIIVGSGIAGFFAAAALLEGSDLDIAVLEQNGLIGATTRAAGGHGANLNIQLGDLTSTHTDPATGTIMGPMETRARFEQFWYWRQRGAAFPVAWAASAPGASAPVYPAINETTFVGEHRWPNLRTSSFIGLFVRESWEFMNQVVPVIPTGVARTDAVHTWLDTNHPGTVRLWSRATRLHQDEAGNIIGVQYTRMTPNPSMIHSGHYSVTRNIRARQAVIMATGSAHGNREMLEQFGGAPIAGISNARGLQYNISGGQPFMNMDGLGHRMVVEVGGAIQPAWSRGILSIGLRAHPALMNLPQFGHAFYTPGNRPLGNTGAGSPIAAAAIMNTALLVDAHGERFRAETNLGGLPPVPAVSLQQWPLWMILSSGGHGTLTAGTPAMNIIDAAEAASNSALFGSNFHFPGVSRHSDAVKSGATLMELATNMGIPEAHRQSFVDMVTAYDVAVETALAGGGWVDPLTLVTRPGGLPAHVAKDPGIGNVNLRRFNQGPFYAVLLFSAGSEIMNGVLTNYLGQVVDAYPYGNVIGGGRLFAVGGLNNRDHWGEIYGGSINMKGAAGWIAAQHIMGRNWNADPRVNTR